jgi:hypothetical protein
MAVSQSSVPSVPDDRAVSVGRIRGAAFREFLLWYEIRYRGPALARAIDAIPSRFRARLDLEAPAFGVRPVAWYPATLVHGLIDGLLVGLGPEERSVLARESGEFVTERTIRGTFRMLFELIATPERCARHAQRMWRAYYETGLSMVTRVSPTCYEQRVSGWREHHAFICEMHGAAAVVLYRAMGVSRPVVERIGCVSDGRAMCASRVSWEP